MNLPVSSADDAFVARYRERPGLGYLPPPGWVRHAPAHVLPGGIVCLVDEMGKQNVAPIVSAEDSDEAAAQILRAAAGLGLPARLEWRVLGDGSGHHVARQAGLVLDRVQAGMHARLDASSGAYASVPARADRPEAGELRDLYNTCFGLTLSVADIDRMRGHPAWQGTGLFTVRDEDGLLFGSIRLVTDFDATGRGFGFLRGLAILPDHRSASMPFILGLYQAAIEHMVGLGVKDCYLLVDRATGHAGSIMRRLYESLGFVSEEMVYRFREPGPGAARATLRRA